MSAPEERPRPFPLGRIVTGVVLLLVGAGWLLQAIGAVDVPLRAIFPVALVLTGIALIVGSRSGSHGGLIVLGLVLTLALTVGSIVAPTDGFGRGGVGERVERPASIDELSPSYRLDAGELTLDLSRLVLPDRTTGVRARVGMGQMQVLVPEGLSVVVDAEVGLGQLDVFGDESGGLRVVKRIAHGEDAADARLELDLSVGIGQIEVREVPPSGALQRQRDRIQEQMEDTQERLERLRSPIEDGARRG